MRILGVVLGLSLLLPVRELSAQAKPVDVDLTSQGATLKGSYFSAGKPGPGIVLFHQCSGGASRRLWDSLAGDLVAAGFHVMTFDSRGFGETRGALLLLSGTPSLRGFTHIQETPTLAVLAVYAEQDMVGTPIAKVVPASKHPQSMTRAYPGQEHGVALFTAQPDLKATIAKWLAAQMK